MYILEGVLLNLTYLLFPLSLYLIYQTYVKNMDLKEKALLLEIALFTSMYFTIKYGVRIGITFPMILFNIPLIISYFKKRKIAQLLISIVLVWYYNINLNINIWFLVLEYLLYFVVYDYVNLKKKSISYIINAFTGIKAFFISFEMFLFIRPEYSALSNVVEIIMVMIIYTSFAYGILSFLLKGEKTVDLNNTLHELEKEKTLRHSLFKLTHEIKNPIAVCKGYLDMLDYKDEDKLKRYIPIIKNEIERTITLMDGFLDYTKVQIDKKEIDIIMLLEDTIDSINPLFKKNNIETEIDIPDDEVYMQADYNRLKQVFINVFKNAVEAKDENRNLRIEIETKIKNKKAYIKIKDNGVGIENENLNKMGEMFFTTKEKGTGLGVSLSKEIVLLHGGSMKYNSKKDKGTTVTITLPVTV